MTFIIFADDNTMSAIGQSIPELIDSLTLKSNLAIDWFQSNSMIVSPDKLKAIVLTKSKQNTSGVPISLNDHCIATQDTAKLLGITTDCRLSLEKHVSGLCKTAASQLNVLKRLCPYMPYEKTRKTLVQSFVLSHYDYCPLVWYFTTVKQLQKI